MEPPRVGRDGARPRAIIGLPEAGQATGRSARACRGRRPCRGARAVWGIGGRRRHSSSRPPPARKASAHSGHQGVTRREMGSTTRTVEPAFAAATSRASSARRASSASSFTVKAARMPAGGFGRSGGRGVAADRTAVEAEAGPGPVGLRDRPAAAVDTLEARPRLGLERPRRARGPGAAAEVEDAAGRAEGEAAHDPAHEQEVQGAVVEGEGGPLAGAVERRPARHPLAPLDVEGGQRLQRVADLLEGQLREVARLEGGVERVEGIGRLHAAVTIMRAPEGKANLWPRRLVSSREGVRDRDGHPAIELLLRGARHRAPVDPRAQAALPAHPDRDHHRGRVRRDRRRGDQRDELLRRASGWPRSWASTTSWSRAWPTPASSPRRSGSAWTAGTSAWSGTSSTRCGAAAPRARRWARSSTPGSTCGAAARSCSGSRSPASPRTWTASRTRRSRTAASCCRTRSTTPSRSACSAWTCASGCSRSATRSAAR